MEISGKQVAVVKMMATQVAGARKHRRTHSTPKSSGSYWSLGLVARGFSLGIGPLLRGEWAPEPEGRRSADLRG